MGFRVAELLSHLGVVRSVKPTTLARRLISLLPDYWLTDGYSSTLVNITLELTYKCNLQCSFCFIKDVLNTKRAELSFEEIRGLVADAKDLGAGFFLIGGEPFARRDTVDIVELIKSEGLKCGANTNGILLSNRDMDRLAASGMDYLIFSL
ncbi:MAG: radical SAM protein, partial [Planctomycetota bacterium]